MTGAALGGIAALILGLIITCAAGAATLLGGDPSACTLPTAPTPTITAPAGGWPVVDPWDRDQVANATIIAAVGAQHAVPAAGQVIAVATAMQESNLRNLPGGDRDSVGLFQQRPSQGWGGPQQLRDPVYAARAFYRALLAVRGWQRMPLTVAAQAVQRSAHPTAYAKWAEAATQLHKAVASASPREPADWLTFCESACSSTPNSTLPAAACPDGVGTELPGGAIGVMLRAALDQVGDPYVYAATGPDAFDCSGLVVYAWQQAGYQLTVRTAEQMRQVSIPVPAGQERPGDLMFSEFNTPRVPNGAGHVAIVARPGLVIEAPRTGLDVRLRSYTAGDPQLRFGRLRATALRLASTPEPPGS
jgi:cell wall-associated NlpC family hydrolase